MPAQLPQAAEYLAPFGNPRLFEISSTLDVGMSATRLQLGSGVLPPHVALTPPSPLLSYDIFPSTTQGGLCFFFRVGERRFLGDHVCCCLIRNKRHYRIKNSKIGNYVFHDFSFIFIHHENYKLFRLRAVLLSCMFIVSLFVNALMGFL